MAREAGFVFPETQEDSFTCWWEELERFFNLAFEAGAANERDKHLNLANEVAWSVALAEREACAKVADGELMNTNMLTSYPPKSSAAWNIAAAIRARSN